MCSAMCRRCLDWVDAQGAREGDTAADRLRRRLLVPLMVAEIVPVTLAALVVIPDKGFDKMGCYEMGMLICMLIVYVGAPTLLWSPLSTARVTSAILLAYLIPVLMWDLGTALWLKPRTWSMCVLLLDACLVFSLDPWVQNMTLVATTLYLAVERSEAAGRWGLYQAGLLFEPAAVPLTCDCSEPPCSRPWFDAFVAWGSLAIVFFSDFVMTRYFAVNLRHQMKLVSASISVAEQVSGALARFDLDSAGAALIETGESLPPGLAGSLRRLLSNLASYRPYLPQSCFEGPHDDGEASSAEESGLDHDEVEAFSAQQTPGSQALTLARTQSSHSAGTSVASSAKRPSAASDAMCCSPATESSNSSAKASFSGLHTASRLQHQPQLRKVTLLARNSCGLLSAPALCDAAGAAAAAAHWLAAEVDHFSALVSAQGGMTDMLSGDHMSASFGAVRIQGTQRESAVRAAMQLSSISPERGPLQQLQVTTAVCSGRALCGDFGSAHTQRFMVIGGVGALLPALERAAAAWRVDALVDPGVQQDVDHRWNCRLRGHGAFAKVSAKPIGLWEVVSAKERASAGPEEWMYELENAGDNPWEPYNTAVGLWCEGQAAKAQAVIAQVQMAVKVSEDAVLAGVHALREAIQSGAAAPRATLAAFAGGPAPLQEAGDDVTPS